MPWPTYESLPKAVKTMLKNLGAGKGSKLERQWRNVANSCIKKGGKEVSCIKQANSVVQKAAKGDSETMDIEWTDLPESAQKAIKDVGGGSMSEEFDCWVGDYTFCRNRGGTDEKCKTYATAWMESRKTLHLPMPDGSKMKITDNQANEMVLYHEPITFNAEEGEIVKDSVTGKDVYRVPITATRQGVMNSHFKPWDELQNSFWTLEHKPIIAPSHPPDGEPVTSRVFDNIVGFISDVHLNEEDTSVRAFHNYFMDHAWVVANLDKIGKEQQATSVGYYAITEMLEEDESFDGVSYNLVDRFMYFDHNAHLVNIPAACPVPSCGIMVNEEGYNMTESETESTIVDSSSTADPGIKIDTTTTGDWDRPIVWIPPNGTNTITITTDILSGDNKIKKDKKHSSDCPPGQHMVNGKCVKKNKKDKDCPCSDSKTESEGKQLNTQKSIKVIDNMTEEESIKVTDKTPEKDSVKDAPIRATAGSIEARVMEAENRKLQENVQSLMDRISELESIEKERKDAEMTRLREIAVELNSDFEAFSDEEISEMDEKTLGTAIKALSVKASPGARAVFGNTKKDTSPYRSAEFAPLTVFAEKKEGD